MTVSIPAFAQNEPVVVAPVEGRVLRFNWPRAGDVFVRNVTLPVGRSRLQVQALSQIAGGSTAYAPSLKLAPPTKLIKSLPTLKFGAALPKPASVSFFDSFQGQRVTLLQETRTGEKTVTGILRWTDGRYSLETEGGILYAPEGQWLLPGTLKPAAPSSKNEEEKTPSRSDAPNSYHPVWLVEGGGKTQVETNYTLRGLIWTPRYTGFLSADRKSAQM